MKFIVFLSCLLLVFPVFAQGGWVKLLKHSTTKKTFILNKGSHHKINTGDFAVLLFVDENSIPNKKILTPLAKLKSVKTFQQSSIWLTIESFDQNKINAGNSYILVSEKDLLEGRTNLTIKRKEIVTIKNVGEELKESLVESGQDLSVKKENYKELSTLHDKEKYYDKDIELIDVSKWEREIGKIGNSKTSIYKSAYAKDFSDRKRIATFEKMLVHYLARVNDPNFDFNQFYKDQERSIGIREVQKNLVSNSFKNKYEESLKNKKEKLEKISEQISLKSDSWSDEYSDEELSEIISNVGAIKEKQRRVDLLGFSYDYQFYISTSLGIIDNQVLNNSQNLQNNKFEIEISGESFSFKNLDILKSFTFEFSFKNNQDGLSVGTFNAKLNEFSGAFHVNWYPFHDPHLLDKNIFFMGILLRTGIGSLIINSENEESIYQISSIPGFRTGIKYNFYNGIGLRLIASYENVIFDRIENVTGGSNLAGRESYINGKIGIGLSKLF